MNYMQLHELVFAKVLMDSFLQLLIMVGMRLFHHQWQELLLSAQMLHRQPLAGSKKSALLGFRIFVYQKLLGKPNYGTEL